MCQLIACVVSGGSRCASREHRPRRGAVVRRQQRHRARVAEQGVHDGLFGGELRAVVHRADLGAAGQHQLVGAGRQRVERRLEDVERGVAAHVPDEGAPQVVASPNSLASRMSGVGPAYPVQLAITNEPIRSVSRVRVARRAQDAAHRAAAHRQDVLPPRRPSAALIGG